MRWNEIFTDRIDELFNTNIHIDWRSGDNFLDGDFSITGKDGQKNTYKLFFYNPENNIWTVSFSLEAIGDEYYNGKEYGNTGTGGQFQVYSVVVNAIEEFVAKKNPDVLRFSGKISEGKDVLYRKMIKFLGAKVKKYGYSVTEDDYYGASGQSILFILTKNKNESLTELFDSEIPLTWSKRGNRRIEASFVIPSSEGKVKYLLQFDRIEQDSNDWDLGFHIHSLNGTDYSFIGNRYGNSQTGNEFQVYSAVVNGIEKFIKDFNPDSFYFSGNKILGKDKLYRKMISYLSKKISKYGFSVKEEPDLDDYVKFYFTKNKNESIVEHSTSGGTSTGNVAHLANNGSGGGMFGCSDFSKSIYGIPDYMKKKDKNPKDNVIRRNS